MTRSAHWVNLATALHIDFVEVVIFAEAVLEVSSSNPSDQVRFFGSLLDKA
jgi:hypothetical protein